MVFSKLTQVCKVIKLIYFVILQQTKTKRRLICSTYLSRTINNSVLVITVKAKSVTLRLIISAVFWRCCDHNKTFIYEPCVIFLWELRPFWVTAILTICGTRLWTNDPRQSYITKPLRNIKRLHTATARHCFPSTTTKFRIN